jgi:DNA topoisomerase-3
LFISRQKEVVDKGWKALLPERKSSSEDPEFSAVRLPEVIKGEGVLCIDGKLMKTPHRHVTLPMPLCYQR